MPFREVYGWFFFGEFRLVIVRGVCYVDGPNISDTNNE